MKFHAGEFLTFGLRTQEFDDLLVESMRTRKVLTVTFDGEMIELKSTPPSVSAERAPVEIIGASVVIRDGYSSPGARLFAPLLMSIEEVRLPHHHVFSMRRHDRSVADFFARNIYYALGRPDGVRCVVSPPLDIVRETSLQAEFSRRYLWVLRHEIPDPLLHESDLIDRLWINAYVKMLAFEEPIFELGANEIRKRRRDNFNKQDKKVLLARLMHAREKMMAHFS